MGCVVDQSLPKLWTRLELYECRLRGKSISALTAAFSRFIRGTTRQLTTYARTLLPRCLFASVRLNAPCGIGHTYFYALIFSPLSSRVSDTFFIPDRSSTLFKLPGLRSNGRTSPTSYLGSRLKIHNDRAASPPPHFILSAVLHDLFYSAATFEFH